ncbi:MAG: hypothetical protein ACREBI_11180 [Nitrosotalea sp.]
MKILHLSILISLFLILSGITLLQTASASPFLQIDKNTYVKGDVILVYGSVGNYVPNTLVTIQVLDNNNTKLLALTTNPKSDASFIVRIPTNGTDWKTGSPYDVKVQYGPTIIGDSTFVFYADHQLSPLQQSDAGIPFWDIKCDSGLVTIMKQEDGTVACVKPSSLQKLISLNWGYDPSEKLTVYGLKDVYQVGQEIDFKFRINGFGGYCDYQPSITVKDYDQKIVWQSSRYIVSCHPSEGGKSGHREDEAFLGSEAHLGYDYNNYGPLIIKQTGTYSMNISWLDGNVTKEFTVIANQTSLSALKLYLSTNSTSIQSGQAIGIDVSLNNTSLQQLTLPVQDNWQINGLGSGGCSFLPIGITILDGYYTEQNMTDKKSLSFYFQPPCAPFNVSFKSFVFQPISSKAIAECESTDSHVFSCPQMIEMRYNVAYSNVLENGDFHPFNSGVYTVVGGDEWGHVAVQHFTVTNSTGG